MNNTPKTAREVLNIIDMFLEDQAIRRMNNRRHGVQGDNLWSVLTALRSDDTHQSDKQKTTAPIRAKAFPRFAKAGMSSRWGNSIRAPKLGQVWTPLIGGTYDADALGDAPRHFKSHAERAAKALRIRTKKKVGL